MFLTISLTKNKQNANVSTVINKHKNKEKNKNKRYDKNSYYIHQLSN